MRVRSLLIATAVVSSILGGAAVYLVLSVPNDLKADAMMKAARKNLDAGKRDAARKELSSIVQHYPRTDAAAAATLALISLGNQERKDLEAEIKQLRDNNARSARTLDTLSQNVETIKSTPPKVIVEKPPARKPAPAKKKAAPRRRSRH